jgi:2-oxoisovalerate dehydrogenase E1 component alpha subunit
MEGSQVQSIESVRHRYIGSDGSVEADLPEISGSTDTLVALYRAMVRTRHFDEKAVALQRTGRLGTYASSLGQEAVGAGVASAMSPDDVLLPSFREQGAMLWRGVTMTELLLYWGGDERGSNFGGPRHDFPVCIPVGTQFPHAVGVALAMKLRREPRVAVVVGGDGSTSKGDFYEALNLAGVWQVPAVFVINNNQWAISVARSAQSRAETLAQKAVAAGIPGVQVDGNDVVAVRHAAECAVARARRGEGPSVIEAVTYRLSDHTTADDARRYRSETEVSEHWKEDPVSRLRTHLVSRNAWDKDAERGLLEACLAEIETATTRYLAFEPQCAANMFDYLHAELPAPLVDQREFLDKTGGERHA